MSVRKAPDPRYPGKPWIAEVYRDGRQRRRFETRRSAERWERETKDAPRAPSRGLEEALLEYLTVEVPRLRKPSDPKSHARAIREHIRGKTFDDVPDVVRAITRDGKRLSVATVNRRLALLRRLCSLAVEWGWLEHAPRVRLLPGETTREVYLSRDQVEQLAERMPRGGNVLRLCAYTGLRKAEALALTAGSIANGGVVVETLKQKRRRQRWVPLPARIAHLAKVVPFDITEQVLRKEWERARAELGLDHVRFHDSRHTAASFMAAAGFTDGEIMEILGHTDPRMTARYRHLTDRHLATKMRDL